MEWRIGRWAVLVALLIGCGGETGSRGRVLLIGIDGATLRVAQPLLRDGRLPQLAALAGAGAGGPLRSHKPLVSPRIWTSMATGKLPAKHGIRSFALRDANGKRLYRSSDRHGAALWNIVSAAGLSVGVVNWWDTHPVEKITGVMVSDHVLPSAMEARGALVGAASDPDVHTVWPPEWEPRVRALVADDTPLTDVPDPIATGGGLPRSLVPPYVARSRGDDADVVRIALAVEGELHPDLLMVFLPGIDRVSHRLWGAFEEPDAYDPPLPLSDAERAAGKDALLRYYEFTDALIGMLVARYSADDLVLVVSDHGFEAGNRISTGQHESDRALYGVYFARGPGVGPPAQTAPAPSVNDVTPTILAWLGLPVAADMDGRPAAFLTARPVARVASYDGTPIERLGDERSGAEDTIREQLEALGYLEHETQ